MNNKYKSQDQNTISRLRNLVRALSDYPLLPKIIVVVPDEDILHFIQKAGDSRLLQSNIEIVLKWMMREYERTVAAHLDRMPEKAKKLNYPYFLWIAAPLHENFDNN